MANVLSKSNIANSNTIEAWQVSQSVDAFTGIAAYDITISGSLKVTGSTNLSGSVNVTGGDLTTRGFSNATSSWADNVVNSPSSVEGWLLPSGSTLTIFPIKLLAGYGEIAAGATSTIINLAPAIIAGALGTDVFVSVGISSSYTTSSMAHFPRAASLLASNLTFSIQAANASNPTPFFFTIMYK
jgi:hypothetical protein